MLVGTTKRERCIIKNHPEDFLYFSIFISFLMESVPMFFEEWVLNNPIWLQSLWIFVPYCVVIPASSILYLNYLKNSTPPSDIKSRQANYIGFVGIFIIFILGISYPYIYYFWASYLFIVLMFGISLINVVPWVFFDMVRNKPIAVIFSFTNTILFIIYLYFVKYPFAHHPNTMFGLLYLLSGLIAVLLALMARKSLKRRLGNDRAIVTK